ncbi:hypothetical protein [Streptomyces sp. NPDC003077]|uniref:hypothetical protein n=1 Tax=Streptomyces sp. NPDC003077 TaxID=3154443 RepID=UPI0033A82119
MQTTESELIWQGRVHLGDEPGVYADAAYSGLAVEIPVTVIRTVPSGPNTTTLTVDTQDVRTFAGYPGHLVQVFLFEPEPNKPGHFQRTVLASRRLTTADNNHQEVPVDFTGHQAPHRVSVRITVDTEVPPGLYDDFVFVRLSNQSENFVYVASLGFRA